MVYLISRHLGTREWCEGQGIKIDHTYAELSASLAQPGDIIIGSLPYHLAAQVCDAGAEFYYISMDVPLTLRGQELSAEQMQKLGAKLQAFDVKQKSGK